MSPSSPRLVLLADSEHLPVPNATHLGKAAGNRDVRVSIILCRQKPLDIAALGGRQLSREEYDASYGASQEDFDAVKAYAQAQGLTVDEQKSSRARRRVEVRGTVAAINAAFGVELNDYEATDKRAHEQNLTQTRVQNKGSEPARQFHAITGTVSVPENLAGCVEAVLGLDNRPIATPKIRVSPNASASAGTFTPPQVAQVYNFPTAGNGAGQTIGIIELGGGYNPADITNYFQSIGLAAPTVTDVLLDGGANDPTTADSADGEVLLDIEVAGGVAPGAKIVVYFTTNTDQGFQDAISTAIHDTTNNPSVISISWGGPESSWAQTAINSMDSTCEGAAALGITITVASGDSGSSDGGSGDNVDFPASSPNVLACGGTALTASNGQRQSEVVWNDQASGGGATGGGVSNVFPLPSWQANAGVPASAEEAGASAGTSGGSLAPRKHKKKTGSGTGSTGTGNGSTGTGAAATGGRGVPDVSGDASPETGYTILVDGTQEVVGGTSAVAPLWAGLIALLNQQLGRNVGYLNPQIYALPAASFYDVTSGNNGDYSAGPGWDACTGLGSPNGQALLTALKG